MINNFGVGPNTALLLNSVAPGASIINLSSTSRVWISSSPSLASGVGTPLEPLSSQIASKTGPIYAILDSSATDIAQVIITDELNGYDNPIALASAVAAQLFATGVPIPLQTDFIQTVTVHVGDGPPGVTIDVSKYQSLLIVYKSGSVNPISLLFSTDAAAANGVFSDKPIPGFSTPVYAQYVHFYDQSLTGNVTFDVYGTNRVTSVGHPTNQGGTSNYASRGAHLSTGSTTKVAGTTYDMPVSTDGDLFSGPAFAFFLCSGSTVTGSIQAYKGDGSLMPLTDTGEMFTAANGSRNGSKMLALPGDIAGCKFICTVGGGNTVSAWFTPAW